MELILAAFSDVEEGRRQGGVTRGSGMVWPGWTLGIKSSKTLFKGNFGLDSSSPSILTNFQVLFWKLSHSIEFRSSQIFLSYFEQQKRNFGMKIKIKNFIKN